MSLTNADFSAAPVEHGFDWRLPANAGVTVERGGLPTKLWITLDGHEPETCNLVEQVMAIVPGGRYRLRFRYQTDGLAAQSGVRWRLMDTGGHEEFDTDADDLSSELEAAGTIRFRVAANVRLVRLALAYRRTPGTMRIEGRVAVSDVSLEFDR